MTTPGPLRCSLSLVLIGTAPAALRAQVAPTAAAPVATTPPAPVLTAAAPAASPAAARRAAPAATEDDEEEIVVTGQRQRGAVAGDIPPEVQLSPADIRAYGVSSVSDLLDQLSPQTGSSRGNGGPPVVLLEGRRISSFAEIRDIPTEAIARVDILPEEVALKYGYAADQRVVNFVLRPFFRSVVGEAGGGLATEGGGGTGTGDLNLLRIQNGRRLNLDAKYTDTASITEQQRDVISRTTGQLYSNGGNVAGIGGGEIDPALSALAGKTVTVSPIPTGAQGGARPALGDFVANANTADVSPTGATRTLRPATRNLTLNSVYNHPIGKVSATINAGYIWATTTSLQGPPTSLITVPAGNPFSPFSRTVSLYRYADDDALRQRTNTGTGHGGLSLNGDLAPWRWSVTGNYDRVTTDTRTDRGFDQTAYQARVTANDPTLNPFAALIPSVLGGALTDRAHSLSSVGELQGLMSGPVLRLPAGQMSTTLRVGGTSTGFDSDSTRAGVFQATSVSRQTGNGQINLDIPIASRRNAFLPFLGELSINGNAAAETVSNFGTLTTYGYGLNWTPVTPLRLIGSYTHSEAAPTVQQLGNPTISTSGVRVFDYARGTTVDVTQISGGNAALTADNRSVMKLGFTLKPTTKHDLTFVGNYVRQRIRNQVSNLPAATLEIENAFPDRFTRDVNGNLTRIDARPVNFAREDRDTFRFGIDLSIPLKASPALLARQRAAFQAEFARRRAEAIARGETPPTFPGAGQGQGQRQRPAGNAAAPPAADGAAPPPPPPEGVAGGPPPGGGFGGPPPGGGGGFGGPPGGGGGGFGGPPGGGGGGGFGGGGRGGAQAGGRIQFALYDNWTLKDQILIRPGVPILDLLNGASIGTGGGVARHQIQLQLGYSNNGLGARLEGNYNGGTTVRAGPGSTTGDLRFAALSTLNFRLFANLAQLPPLIGKDWARGARLTLSVNNIFNERQKVLDTLGNTPLSYQPAYLDALGRNVRITFRKLFFSIPRRPFQRTG